jgi:SAM-dependent methyltransferase
MAYYDRIARKWHDVTGFHGGAFKKYILNDLLISKIGDVAGRSILELGAGNGYFMPLLLRRSSSQQPAPLVITDQSSPLLELARRHFLIPGAEYLLLEARRRFPFEAKMFDMVLATMVFNEVPTPGLRQALSECHRVLRPAGRLLATVSHPQFSESLARREELRSTGSGVTMPGAEGLRLPVVRRSVGGGGREVLLLGVFAHRAVGGKARCQPGHAFPHPLDPGRGNAALVSGIELRDDTIDRPSPADGQIGHVETL